MVKWTEVSAYSGMPVDEDAPTNATGAAVAGTGDDSSVVVMKKKKKKTFLDARTKAYKAHQKRLEAARARREERKKNASKINEEQLDEREKGIDQLPRQFLNPSKEVMILKKGKVIVIDKKDKDRYMRQGWELAEDEMMEVNLTFIKKFAADMKKDKQFRPFADKFMKIAMKGGSPRDALEKSVPDYISGKDIEKLISKNRMSNIFGEAKSPSDILFHFNSFNDAKKFNDYAEKSKQKLGIKQVVHFTKGQGVYTSSVSIQPKDGMDLSKFEILYKGLDKIAKKFKSVKSIKHLQNSVQEETFSQKVQEQIGGFEREIYLAENNIDVIKSVVKSKGAKNLKMKDGKMMVDLFSASAIMNVYNKVNPNNKKKMEKLANGTRADLGKLQRLAMKFA